MENRSVNRKRVLKQEDGKNKSGGNKKLYKGTNAYTDHRAVFRREQTDGSHGPQRASAYISISSSFDYQPNICKDYKESGFCGYGDSCKFLHDRGDYKSGCELEKEWDQKVKAARKGKALKLLENEEDAEQSDDENSQLLVCSICRQQFVDPVVTKCKHYFCQKCALTHHATNKKCFVCNKPTLGIFNTAQEIRKRMASSALD